MSMWFLPVKWYLLLQYYNLKLKEQICKVECVETYLISIFCSQALEICVDVPFLLFTQCVRVKLPPFSVN